MTCHPADIVLSSTVLFCCKSSSSPVFAVTLTLLRYLSLKSKPHVVTVPVPESKTSRCDTCPWKQTLTLLRYLSLKAKPRVTVRVPESKTSRCYGTCPWKQTLTLLRYLSLKAKPHVTVPVPESKTSRYGTCPWKQNLTLRYLSLKCCAGMKAVHFSKDLQTLNTSLYCRTIVLPPRHKFSCVHVGYFPNSMMCCPPLCSIYINIQYVFLGQNLSFVMWVCLFFVCSWKRTHRSK